MNNIPSINTNSNIFIYNQYIYYKEESLNSVINGQKNECAKTLIELRSSFDSCQTDLIDVSNKLSNRLSRYS